MNLRARTQVRALRKQNQILQLKHTLHDLIRISLDLYPTLIIRHDHRLTVHKVTYTAKDQVRIGARNLQLLRQRIEITTDLLEIHRWHMNDRGKRNVRKFDVLHIRIEELHHPGICRPLFCILRANTQLIRITGRKEQSQAIIIRQGLNQLEEVNHVDTEHILGRTVEILKTIGMEAQIGQHSMGLIDINDLDPR